MTASFVTMHGVILLLHADFSLKQITFPYLTSHLVFEGQHSGTVGVAATS